MKFDSLFPILSLLILLSISGCQTPGDVTRTFTYGHNFVPRAALQEGQDISLIEIRKNPGNWRQLVSEEKLRPGTKLPAVIYLHGCGGYGSGNVWWNVFDQLGYAFFAPSSMSRPRQSLCGTGRASMLSTRIPMRIEETQYVLSQIRDLPWIDQRRLVLFGHSEGSQAASRYKGREFAAIIMTGTDCRFANGQTPLAPLDVAVLSMVGSNDRYGIKGQGCNVENKVGGSRKVIFEGLGHDLSSNSRVREVLKKFLRECCSAVAE